MEAFLLLSMLLSISSHKLWFTKSTNSSEYMVKMKRGSVEPGNAEEWQILHNYFFHNSCF